MFKRTRRGPWPPPPKEEPLGPRFKAVISTITEVVTGGILRAGKTAYGSGTGWWLGKDPADNECKFDIGSPSQYFRYDETNGVQIAADGSGMTQIDGAHIQAGSIVLTGLASPVTDRMFDTGTLSENIQAWIHANNATLIDGANIYTGSILVTGLENGIIARMFGSQATRDNIQAWVHDNDATLIDGGDIYTNTVTATQIDALTITGAEIAALAITALKIEVGTITFDRMVSGALSNNLIVNPGFEDGSDPHNLATDGDGTWAVQDSIKRSGSYALHHDPAGQTSTARCHLNGDPTASGYLYRHVNTWEGKKYNFVIHAYRAAATTGNMVRLYTRFYNASASLLNAYYTSFDPADWTDDTWTECTSGKTAPAGAAYVVFDISILDNDETGDLYFDDIEARTKVGSGLIEVDAVLAEHIAVTNLAAVSAQTGALTVDNTLTMGADGIISWMSGAAKITDDYMDLALTTSDRYAFRFLDGAAVHAYLGAYKSANLTQLSIEVTGPAEDKYAKIAFSAIEFIDEDPETADLIIRSDTGVLISALNYGAARIFKVDTMDAYFTNKVSVGPTAPAGKLHVDQSSDAAAIPVVVLDQADLSEEFIRFISKSGTSATRALVDAVDKPTIGALKGYIKIYVEDTQATNPIVDGDYYIPFYAEAS